MNLRLRILAFLFAPLVSIAAQAQIHFVENRGQWEADILFRADIPEGYLSIEKNALVYTRIKVNNPEYFHHGPKPGDTLTIHNLRVAFEGASLQAQGEGEKKRNEYHNYFLGNDPSRWATKVPLFERVLIRNLYPGIDLEVYGRDARSVKYDFIVHPGADPTAIRLHYLGAESLKMDKGDLLIETAVGTLREKAPYSYQLQGKNPGTVRSKFMLDGTHVQIRVSDYSPNYPLVIDPVVIFSTYTGSTADNFGFTATYDHKGNGFAGGDVRGGGYPSTPGVVQRVFHGGTADNNEVLGDVPRDCGIMKLSPDGRTKVWATYIGGSGNEQPHSMVVDKNNNLIVMGSTFSSDFPNDGMGFSTSYKGKGDIFVIKISEDGTSILGMTYLGGSARDGLNGRRPFSSLQPNTSPLGWNFGDEFRGEVIVDSKDNVYLASCTESSIAVGFPAKNSFNTQFRGTQDGCLFKLSPDLRKVEWGAYIGGPDFETSYGVALDGAGNVFVCGGSNSSGLNFGPGALNPAYQGGIADGYVMKISPDGNTILGGTFLGTGEYDQAHFVQVDKWGNVFVAGQTRGSWPVFPDDVYREPNGGQFITKLNNDLKTQQFSSIFGDGIEKPQISLTAFLVDSCERIFISGWGGEENDPTLGLGHGGNTARMKFTKDAYDSTTDGSDFYLAVYSKNMNKLLYATFIGGGSPGLGGSNVLGEHVDGGTSRFDPKGIVYQSVCGGCGGPNTPDFPTTAGAYSQSNNSDNCNNALFKLDFENLNAAPDVRDTLITLTAGDTLRFDYIGSDEDDSVFLSFEGEAINGSSFPKPYVSIPSKVSALRTAKASLSWISGCLHAGMDTIVITARIFDKGCPESTEDSAYIRLVVQPPPAPNPPEVICMKFGQNDQIHLSWKDTDTSGYLDFYLLYKQIDGGQWQVIDTFYKTATQEFTDPNSQNYEQTDYCYKVVGVNICGTLGPESYTICSIDQFNKPIEGTEIITTTVVDNKNLYTVWKKSTEPDFKGYSLYRKYNDPKASYEFMKLFEERDDTFFLDPHVDVHHYSYCYALSVTDKCGNNSSTSDPGCSILLQGESLPYRHDLVWNPYRVWRFGVQQYDLIRHDDRMKDTLIGMGDDSWLAHSDTSLDYDWGGYWYTVMATENSGNLATSTSNTVYLIQPPLLHVPTAFTRNRDGLNDVWGITDVFVKEYHLLVFNRWGQKLVDTWDKNYQWDGYFRSEDPFDNVFIWYVTYTGWDGSAHSQKGTLTILR